MRHAIFVNDFLCFVFDALDYDYQQNVKHDVDIHLLRMHRLCHCSTGRYIKHLKIKDMTSIPLEWTFIIQ